MRGLVVDLKEYYSDLQKGTLLPFSWIDAAFALRRPRFLVRRTLKGKTGPLWLRAPR